MFIFYTVFSIVNNFQIDHNDRLHMNRSFGSYVELCGYDFIHVVMPRIHKPTIEPDRAELEEGH